MGDDSTGNASDRRRPTRISAVTERGAVATLMSPLYLARHTMTTNGNFPLPLTGFDAGEWMRSWQSLWRPDQLTQPILPGWTLNVNSNNSTAPTTEADIVARHSYGRQLGRISDALDLLITERHGRMPKDKRFTDFLAMKHEIDGIKRDAAAARIEQMTSDLALLEAQDDKRYQELRKGLLAALGR